MENNTCPAVGENTQQFINKEIARMLIRPDMKAELAIVRLLKSDLDEHQRNDTFHNVPNQQAFNKILSKQLKKLNDEKQAFASAGRDTTTVDKQIAYVQGLLPAQMTEQELRSYIKDYVEDYSEMPSKLNIGAIMASLNLRFDGQFDKGLASRIAKEMLAK